MSKNYSIKMFFADGKSVDPFNLKPSDLTIVGIARALARINRFTGNGKELEYVSVAQHSVNLSYLVPAGLEKAALLHDVCEVFSGDIPTPYKRLFPEVEAAEELMIRQVAKVFNVPYSQFLEIRPFDRAIASDEARFLFPEASDDPYVQADRGLGIEVLTMDTARAADAWSRRFYELFAIEGGYEL